MFCYLRVCQWWLFNHLKRFSIINPPRETNVRSRLQSESYKHSELLVSKRGSRLKCQSRFRFSLPQVNLNGSQRYLDGGWCLLTSSWCVAEDHKKTLFTLAIIFVLSKNISKPAHKLQCRNMTTADPINLCCKLTFRVLYLAGNFYERHILNYPKDPWLH